MTRDGRHVAATTPGKCSRWFAEEKQYVTVDCSTHSGWAAGTVFGPEGEPARPQPACGSFSPHEPHNGFAMPGSEPWCKGALPTVAQYRDLNARVDLLQREREEMQNQLDTASADWKHLQRWGGEQLDRLRRDVELEVDKDDPSARSIIALANQRRGIRLVLAEMSRLENA